MLELQNAINKANEGTDPVARDLFEKISEAINTSNLGFENGELVYNSVESNVTVEGGCNRTVILQIDTDIKLNSDTSLSLSLDSLYDPVVLSVDVSADIKSIGEAQQILGIRLDKCTNLIRDGFDFSAVGPARFSLEVSLFLNPEWTEESTLSLFPKVELTGQLTEFSLAVDVQDTVLAKLLEAYIENQIDETFSKSRLVSELEGLEKQANNSLSSSFDNGQIDIELPEANDEQIIALYQYLQPEARFPITLDMIRQNRQRILSSILFGEPASLNSIFADAVLCESASVFLSDTQPASIYSNVGGECVAENNINLSPGAYWSDAACSKAIDYQATSVSEYCAVALDPDRFGNAAILNDNAEKWTLSPGTRLDIGALSLDKLPQPLMRRYKYKSIETARGTCELEMRVYSGAAATNGLRKPLIALHGGSWQHRASGFIGVEASAAHFTNTGFTVFAPFYRLIGEADGNVACNDASLADVVDDVNDAMDWVTSRAAEFELTDKPTLFGQSAGGHLALSLAVNRADEVRRAILLYTPTDFGDFADQIKSGTYTNPLGFKILETVTGNTIDALDIESSLVIENSFPARVAAAPENYPPMFLMHGEMDSLLPYRQSVLLCNALSGSRNVDSGFEKGPASLAPNLNGYQSITQCNPQGSVLHLIAEGDHALDLCLAPGLCLSGGEESTAAVASSMQAMLDWSSAQSVEVNSLETLGSGSGLGRVHYLLHLMLLVAVGARRFCFYRLIARS